MADRLRRVVGFVRSRAARSVRGHRVDERASTAGASLQDPTGADGGVWQAFGGLSEGCGGSIAATALAPNGNLYVGGTFMSCGDVPAACMARWDGAAWSALGSGIDGAVNAIATSGSDVNVAGQIHSGGGVPVSGIARWDGTQWHALGDDVGGLSGAFNVYAVLVGGDDVYVGGSFDAGGGAPVNNVARIDANGIHALGSGSANGVDRFELVNAIAVSGTDVLVGGFFGRAGGRARRTGALRDG